MYLGETRRVPTRQTLLSGGCALTWEHNPPCCGLEPGQLPGAQGVLLVRRALTWEPCVL